MKRVLTQITHLILLAVFLTAYMGVSITKHTCVSCKTTMYYLFTHEDCCADHSLTHNAPTQSCCSSHAEDVPCAPQNINNNHNCCQSEKLYLRISENILPAASLLKTQAQVIDIPDAAIAFLSPALMSEADNPSKNLYSEPPPEPTARQRLILHTQFVFYA